MQIVGMDIGYRCMGARWYADRKGAAGLDVRNHRAGCPSGSCPVPPLDCVASVDGLPAVCDVRTRVGLRRWS